MTAQLDLFQQPRARALDPQTSKRAAERVASVTPGIEARILDLLGQYQWAMTKDEICEHLKIHPRKWPTVASALSRLRNRGQLKWTGEVVDGQNVWKLREEIVQTGGRL